jgi:hypothetical protein
MHFAVSDRGVEERLAERGLGGSYQRSVIRIESRLCFLVGFSAYSVTETVG